MARDPREALRQPALMVAATVTLIASPPMDGYDDQTVQRAHEDSYPWEPAWKGEFLRNFRVMPNVTHAARAAGIVRQHVYWARGQDPLFALVMDDAKESGADTVERFAFTLGTAGIETTETRTVEKRALNSDGVLVVVESTTITTTGRLIDPATARFMLSRLKPGTYGNQPQELRHTGADGGPVQVQAVDDIDRQIAALSAELELRAGAEPVPAE